MSGAGSPDQVEIDGRGRRIAIVAARWHHEITDVLLDGAVAEASARGLGDDDVEVYRVPGAFEVPVVADALARSGRVGGVVCLAVVVRGDTPHFDYVCRAVTDGCNRVALDHGVPVGFGVLTVDTVEQALARAGGDAGHKGREAVLAVLETAQVLDDARGGRRGHSTAGFAATPRH